jgi:hypothetical protein
MPMRVPNYSYLILILLLFYLQSCQGATPTPSPTRQGATPTPAPTPACGPWKYSSTGVVGGTCLQCPTGRWGLGTTPCTDPANTCLPSRCSPVINNVVMSGCALGAEGYLCDACMGGYYKGLSSCVSCPQSFFPAVSMVALVAFTIVVLIALFFKKSDPLRRTEFSNLLAPLLAPSLLSDHFTRLFLLHRLGTVPFPNVFSTSLGFTAFVAFDFTSAGPECAISGISFRDKWVSVIAGLACVQIIAVFVDIGTPLRAVPRLFWSPGGTLTAAFAPVSSAPLYTANSVLSLVLPLAAQLCWSALTAISINNKSVLYWDLSVQVWAMPQVIVSTLCMAILFFYVLWVLRAVFRFFNLYFNSAPPVAFALAGWQASVRSAGFLRTVTIVLSPQPVAASGLLVSVGLVELLLAARYFDTVKRALDGGVGGTLAPYAPHPEPPQFIIRYFHLRVALAISWCMRSVRTRDHIHFALILFASFLSQITGLHYASSNNDTGSKAATTWGIVLVLLNVIPIVTIMQQLAVELGPAACQLCPSAAEKASARLASGGGGNISSSGDIFVLPNPLANIGAQKEEEGSYSNDWFTVWDGKDSWYENVVSRETSWVLPEGARHVAEPGR